MPLQKVFLQCFVCSTLPSYANTIGMTHLWYLGFYNLPHCIALVANIGRPWRKLINRILKWKELKLNFATVIAHWGLLLLYTEANNFKWNYSFYVSGEFARRSDFKFWDLEVFQFFKTFVTKEVDNAIYFWLAIHSEDFAWNLMYKFCYYE